MDPQDIINNMYDAVVVISLKGRFEYFTPQLKDLMNGTEIKIGESLFDYLHPDDLETLRNKFFIGVKNKATLTNKEIRFRVRLDKGVYKWLEARVKDYRDEEETLLGFIVTINDISEKVKIEASLRKAKEKFEEVVNRSPIGIGIVDEVGVLIDVNQALADMIGYSREELLKLNFEKITHPDDLEEEWRLIKDMWDGNQTSYHMIKRYVHRDGHDVWVDLNASLVLDKTGKPILGFAFAQDITERKKNVEDLQESKEKLHLKLDSILSPDYEIEEQELENIINSEELQSLMNYFYKLTNIGVAIVDMNGNVLVATGWQDICTKFHRVNPETNKKCIESDVYLASESKKGEYLPYKCKNNMWDIATPIILGGRRVGHLFLGQFFYDDDEIDYDFFENQAEKYGFDKEAYIKALNEVPRWSHDTIDTVMNFYTKLTNLISKLSYSNLKLAKMAQEMEDRKEEYEGIFNSAMDTFLIFDLDGNIIDANPQATEMYGYPHDELLYLTGKDIVHPDHYHLFEKFKKDVINLGSFYTESIDVRKDGSTFNVEVKGGSFNYKGKTHLLAVTRDISERKKAEQQINENLQRSNFYKDLLAHDMSNILNNIKISMQLLDMYEDLPSETHKKRDLHKTIKEQVERGSNLISNVRHLSRIENVKEKIEDVAFLSILDDQINSIFSRFEEKEIEIFKDIPNKELKVKGGDLLANVFQNLLINAIVHNDEDDIKIWISQTLIIKDNKSYVKIEFKDNGVGIPDGRKSLVFERSQKRDTKKGGMGIGLSLVKKIIDAYKGEVWVQDRIDGEKDEGSNFVVLLEQA